MIWWILGLAAMVGVLVAVIAWRRRRSNQGPVSIVMLRRTPRGLTESDVRGTMRRALRAEAQVRTLPMSDGLTKAFLVLGDGLPPIGVFDSTRTYMEADEVDWTAHGFEDPRARSGIKEHRAWVSVDAMGLDPIPPREQRAAIYDRLLGKIAAELLDDACLLLYLPADGCYAAPGEKAGAMLAGEQVMALFNSDQELQEPIIRVRAGDNAINTAIEKAQRRLPEFLQAWSRFGTAGKGMVKGRFDAPGDNAEYMWIQVESADASSITGRVMNRPGRDGLPGRGAVVRLKHAEVVDWAYVDENEKPHGLFVERVLRKS